MESFVQDIRYGLRMLIAKPGFTIIAVLALALGIGANTAIFSIINGVLLKPLHYREPDRLVRIAEKTPQFEQGSVAYPNFKDWRDQSRSFEKMAAYRYSQFNLTGGQFPERVDGRLASADLLSVLGVAPALGRDFLPDDDRTGAGLVAIISNALWQRRFGGDPSIIGKTISLSDDSYTVIGILPADFHFYYDADVYVPISAKKEMWFDSRAMHPGIRVVARLGPGVTMAQAEADTESISYRMGELYPDTNKGHSAKFTRLYDDIVGDAKSPLLILIAAVGAVLLIACANVANLMLARATSRQKEIAVRSALGASRFRIARLLIVESVLLGIVGGGIGLLLAFFGTGAALKALPDVLPRTSDIRIDINVLVFTLGTAILTGVIFGLAPALMASTPDLNETLKEGGRSGTSGKQRVRSVLVVGEIAVALLLLIGAGLLIRSFALLTRVNPGFDPRNVLSMGLSLSSVAYGDPAKMRGFYKELLERTRGIPGVQAASATALVPLGGDDDESPFYINGKPIPPLNELPMAMTYITTPGYLEALRIPLLKGRYFEDGRDTEKTPMVAVIDENMERDYFQGEEPVGKFITLQGGKDISLQMQIVGVAGHVKQENLDTPGGSAIKTQLYIDFAQVPDQFIGLLGSGMDLLVRTDRDPLGHVSAIREQLRTIDPNMPIANARSMEEIVRNSISQRWFILILLGTFSGLALILASIGIYGVISYSVAQRTREIGVRMALGASRNQVMAMVIAEGAKLALIGIVLGGTAAAVVTRFGAVFLYGISPTDPLTFFGISIILTGVALLASYIPARRAMKVDPMPALRYE
jgi:putative ABC transport system permease protein